MSNGSRPEVISVLRRFVHGQLSFDELQGFVRSRNFGWLDELLDGLQLGEADFSELALDETTLARPLVDYVEGRLGAGTFADWSFETYRIFSSSAYPRSPVYSASVEISLLLTCLVTECEVNGLLDRPRAIAHRLLEALQDDRPVPAEFVLRRVLQGMSTVRLAIRPRPESERIPWREEQWADVALATCSPSSHPPTADDCWFIPLAICTRDLWLENPPDGHWAHPENDRIHRLRERFPQLDLEQYEPAYFVGPDGLAEVVLDAARIDEREINAAIRLFCLLNRIRRCHVDGSLCYPTREDR